MSHDPSAFRLALQQIENVIKFKKCHKCGCNQGAIKGLEKEAYKISSEDRAELDPLIGKAKATFQPIEYDCLGCKTCFPGDLGNALAVAYPSLELEPDSCASDDILVEARAGFPVFPGNYQVLRYQAPVAICTLNSKDLIGQIVGLRPPSVSIVGSLNTENLGIERVIRNTISNPNIRYLILCGEDSAQRIGHLPGQTLLALFQNGVDSSLRILGAQGKRPVLKNIHPDEIEQFSKQVTLVNLVGCLDSARILETASDCQNVFKGPFEGKQSMQTPIEPVQAQYKPLRLDPNGYFVIFPESESRKITVEHYLNSGVLNKIVEGTEIGAIYTTISELGLLSRFDHAAYLGKELARAEEYLRLGTPYIQDKAQDLPEADEQVPASCAGKGCC